MKIYKNNKGDDLYKGISLTFKRSVLREFYSKMNKSEMPKVIAVSDDYVFKLQPTPALESLFQSLTSYFDSKVKPTESCYTFCIQLPKTHHSANHNHNCGEQQIVQTDIPSKFNKRYKLMHFVET